MKKCTACNITKEMTEFRKAATGKNGLAAECPPCQTQRSRIWRKNNKELYKQIYKERNDRPDVKIRNRQHSLLRNYGITIEQYEEISKQQKHLCKICNLPETRIASGKVSYLAVDHCHMTGKIRGLLCLNCNRMLGAAKDSIETLLIAINYLKSTK